jgi:SAF domain
MTVTERNEARTSTPPRRAQGRRGRLKRRATPTAPAARFDAGRVAETRHRNPAWLLAGVLLVVLCALGGVLLFSSADERTEVLVAVRDLEAGQPISRGDLRIERLAVDGDIGSLSPADADAIVGLLPVGRIPAGTLLARGMLADEVPLAAGEMVFGAALDPGEAPLSGVQVGVPVELLDVPKANPNATEKSAPAEATVIGSGTVWAVEQLASGQLWISMRVPRDIGLTASEASQSDTLRVVLIGGGP